MKPDAKTTSSPLVRLVSYSDKLLNHQGIADYSAAKNGLQIENDGSLIKIAAAVDTSERTLLAAVEKGASLLIVHHGLFWGDIVPITGFNRHKLKIALDHNLALYSSHLPLDAHPKLGNTVLLAQAVGLKNSKPFFEEKGTFLGQMGTVPLTRRNCRPG